MLSVTNAVDYLVTNWRIGAMAGAVCLAISLCLIARLWLVHRGGGVVSRVAWSGVLLLPIFGWLFFLAFHRAPSRLAGDGHAEHGHAADGGGGHAVGAAGGD